VAWLLLGVVAAGVAAGALAGVAMAPPHRRPLAGTTLSGTIRAPGGPFLFDRYGRVVILHGVDVVYKHPPYEVYPDPGKPWNFDAADARRIARLGFDVVRLGIMWAGLEPGTAPANDPAICRNGPPGDPHQFDAAVLHRYLVHVRQTVDLLGRYHVYTLLDMHQDVYNQMFEGEGEPDWAVCTDGVRSVDPPGRWSLEYATRAAGIAYHHFWTNDVVGDLQGQYDMVWRKVAAFFANDPWVVGYDPFNEPFSTSVLRRGGEHFDGQLECFYTGTAHVGAPLPGAPPIRCPVDDPKVGVIPTILRADRHHLVFFEPDVYSSRGFPSYLGPMDFERLVYNFHVYCPDRNPVTGNPTDVRSCALHSALSILRHSAERSHLASRAEPGGPAWFASEWGASSDVALLGRVADYFDDELLGWAYWSWKYYDDPTGSRDEALVRADGRLRPTVEVLSRTYAEAIAGTPLAMSFDPSNGSFALRYRADRRVHAPTIVEVPTAVHYPHGYCARVTGGRVVSPRGSQHLEVVDAPRARVVTVRVSAGRCPSTSPA
jgi:endoglycosylceramidase